MKLFLNMMAIMLTLAWGISYFVFKIGSIAHTILIMALLVELVNILRTTLHGSFPYFRTDSDKH